MSIQKQKRCLLWWIRPIRSPKGSSIQAPCRSFRFGTTRRITMSCQTTSKLIEHGILLGGTGLSAEVEAFGFLKRVWELTLEAYVKSTPWTGRSRWLCKDVLGRSSWISDRIYVFSAKHLKQNPGESDWKILFNRNHVGQHLRSRKVRLPLPAPTTATSLSGRKRSATYSILEQGILQNLSAARPRL